MAGSRAKPWVVDDVLWGLSVRCCRRRRGGLQQRWRALVTEAPEQLTAALEPDSVVLGGGKVTKPRTLPPQTRLGDNASASASAFTGGLARIVQ